MQIALSNISPSPNPVRQTWDEEQMEQLAQSIREQGVIVPIKVRPNGKGYEVVYGHRRVEASRRAGLDAVPAVVEGMTDDDAFLQAGIENLVREDMSGYDKGMWVDTLIKGGETYHSLSVKTGVQYERLRAWHVYYKEREDGTAVIETKRGGEGIAQTYVIQKHIEDPETKKAIARKVENEGITWKQTENVAQSVAATKDPRRKQVLLDTPYSSFIHDPDLNKARAEKMGHYDTIGAAKVPTLQEAWDKLPEVKAVLDWIKLTTDKIKDIRKMAQAGKFAPEACQFIAVKLNKLADALYDVAVDLEDYDGQK